MTSYKVEGELVIRAQAGLAAVRSLTDRLEGLRARLSGSQTAAGGLVRSLVSMGAAYVGVNALVGGFRSLVSSSAEYRSNIESTRIGLSSVMSAVEGIPFAEAQRQSESLFAQIQDDAIRSTATSQELFGIFQGIYGPLRNAGVATGEIRTTMLDAVSAANALGVDLPQATRDITAMARGAAGLDVRLFSMLRSTGAIAEDAQAFNALSAPERISRMQAALGRFSGAADAYGRSFAGVTSTFRDVVQNLGGALMGPAFNRLTAWLGRLNERLIANRDSIRGVFTAAGERLADALQRAFDRVDRVMDYVANNWDDIVGRVNEAVTRFQALVPALLDAAKAFVAFSAGRAVLAGVVGTLSAITGTIATLAEVSLLAGGGAAAGVGALEASFGALATLAAPLAAALAAVAAVGYVVYDQFESFSRMFEDILPIFQNIGGDLVGIGQDLWGILRPILTVLGTLIGGPLMIAFTALLGILRGLVLLVRIVTTVLRTMVSAVEEYLVDPIMNGLQRLWEYINQWVSRIMSPFSRGRSSTGLEEAARDTTDPVIALGRNLEESLEVGPNTGMNWFLNRIPELRRTSPTAPEERAGHVNDFRGSRITVNQEFRQADPDRILMAMVEDINRQAEQRISSGYVPALTR